MGIRLIFLNLFIGAEWGRSRVGQPLNGLWFKQVGRERRKKTRFQRRDVMMKCIAHEMIDPKLPRKATGCDEYRRTVPQTDSGG